MGTRQFNKEKQPDDDDAKKRRSGLQIRVPRFNSGRGLQTFQPISSNKLNAAPNRRFKAALGNKFEKTMMKAAFDVIPAARVVPAPEKVITCEQELSDGIKPSAICGGA